MAQSEETPSAEQSLASRRLLQVLHKAYDLAVDGVPGMGMDTAEEMARDYARAGVHPYDAANSLIRWQNTKAGTSGFVTNLGGLITLPVAIPANIASVMFVQIRMIAAIAHLGGYDIRDDRVRTLCFACLTGNMMKDLVKDAGVQLGTKMTAKAIERISGETLKAINKAVGFRLVTKAGKTGVVNLGKMVPVVGGLVGGTFDVVATNTIGNVARDTFCPKC